MNTLEHSPKLLRTAFAIDAVATGAMALGLVFAANWLSPHVEISAEFLRNAGLILLPFTAALIYFVSRTTPSPLGAKVMIGLNLLWVVDSVLVVTTDFIAPNGLGLALVVVQGIAVAALASLQMVGLKASRA